MARIKPQALLNQSKKKKGPARISATTIFLCNLVVLVIILSLVATYRHWSQRFAVPPLLNGTCCFVDNCHQFSNENLLVDLIEK